MNSDITFENFLIGKTIKFLNSSAKIYATHPMNKRIKIYYAISKTYMYVSKIHVLQFIRNTFNEELLNEIKEKYPEELI